MDNPTTNRWKRFTDWDERPLSIIVKKPGDDVSKDEILTHVIGRIAKWRMPDDAIFAEEIPNTATGKIAKLQLRETFRNYRLPII